jgi:hypothetical protein
MWSSLMTMDLTRMALNMKEVMLVAFDKLTLTRRRELQEVHCQH